MPPPAPSALPSPGVEGRLARRSRASPSLGPAPGPLGAVQQPSSAGPLCQGRAHLRVCTAGLYLPLFLFLNSEFMVARGGRGRSEAAAGAGERASGGAGSPECGRPRPLVTTRGGRGARRPLALRPLPEKVALTFPRRGHRAGGALRASAAGAGSAARGGGDAEPRPDTVRPRGRGLQRLGRGGGVKATLASTLGRAIHAPRAWRAPWLKALPWSCTVPWGSLCPSSFGWAPQTGVAKTPSGLCALDG